MQQAIFEAPELTWWQFLIILILPALIACTAVVVILRFVQAIHIDEYHQKMSLKSTFKWALCLGIIFGPLCQWGLQSSIHWLTGMPIDFRLIIVAPFITGVFSMLWYECIRIACVAGYNRMKWNWCKGFYHWISVRTLETADGVELQGPDYTKMFGRDKNDT